jgi:hypothetical protein
MHPYTPTINEVVEEEEEEDQWHPWDKMEVLGG